MLAHALKLIQSARHLFLDWDGCLGRGEELLPGAREFLRRFSDKTAIISNNSTELPQDFVGRLQAQGVILPPERILLAGQHTIDCVAKRFGEGPVYLLANGRLRAYARGRGIRLAAKHARAVVLLRDTAFDYGKLATAVALLESGRPLIVSNADRVHPGARGGGVPETGALLAAVQACFDDALEVTVIGKPAPRLFTAALERVRARPDEVVMLGDNAETDIKGARRLGLGNILLDEERDFTLATLNAGLSE